MKKLIHPVTISIVVIFIILSLPFILPKVKMTKYSDDELYLLNRLEYHVETLFDRYKNDSKAQQVVFQKPVKNKNPLL